MKLGLTQPYFFPYLGYFDLIYQTDQWIVFDSVQYIRRGWGNRNRVLHPRQGWQYVVVPIKKCSQRTSIHDIEIVDDDRWKDRIIGQLQHYRKRAPHFRETMSIVEAGILGGNRSLAALNVKCLSLVCQYLEIEFHYEYFSNIHLDLGPINRPGDWALRVSEAMGASEYVNPPGAAKLYDPKTFNRAGIKLTIRHLPSMEYQCNGYDFIPNMSIIDVLMWNTPEAIRAHLEKHG